jgi:hypothetical protein
MLNLRESEVHWMIVCASSSSLGSLFNIVMNCRVKPGNDAALYDAAGLRTWSERAPHRHAHLQPKQVNWQPDGEQV